jgi:hypothetical protein
MSGLLTLLVTIIVLALVCYVLFWILGQIPLPQPIRTVIVVLVALIILVYAWLRSFLLRCRRGRLPLCDGFAWRLFILRFAQ